ncbi:MAG: lysophospholipid acyltransferase family protein [Myxococcota bacterium]|nr:lysophospholipid acyltransferase family protein [Myxococcota bacterium]MEC8423888.1 lysophospholipid acyltransferase family protein [Myxococcota bacterium]
MNALVPQTRDLSGGRSGPAVAFFQWFARRKIAGALDGVYIRGLDTLRGALAEGPVIVALNHASWWDILLIIWLDGLVGADARAVMDARNLKKLPYFGLIGAVPLDRQDKDQSWRDLAAIAELLDRPNRLVFIYPQGRHRPTGIRPLGLKAGVRFLAARAQVPVIPVSVQYGFRETEKITATVDIGAPLAPPTEGADDGWLVELERALTCGLAAGDAWLDRGYKHADGGGFREAIPPRRSAKQDGAAARMLGWFVARATRSRRR